MTKIFDALTFTSPAKPIFLEYPIVKHRKDFLAYRRAVWIRPKSRADVAAKINPETTYNVSKNLMVEIISSDPSDFNSLSRFLWDACYKFNELGDYTYYNYLTPLEGEDDQTEGKWWGKFEVVVDKVRII